MRIAAQKDYKNEKPKLYAIARDTLLRLIDIKDSNDVDIKEVEVWKQWCSIDLVAEVVIVRAGKEEKHVVAFENKAYTQLRVGQLDKCKKNVEKWYSYNDEWKNAEKHYCVVTAFDKGDDKAQPIEKECRNKEFKYYSFYEVIGYGGKDYVAETESDLFNEFWARYWS